MKKNIFLLFIAALIIITAGCASVGGTKDVKVYNLSETPAVVLDAPSLALSAFLTPTGELTIRLGDEDISGNFVFYLDEADGGSAEKQSLVLESSAEQKAFSGLSPEKEYRISAEGLDDGAIIIIKSEYEER